MLLWNQKDLSQPPTITYKSSNQDLDLMKLRTALQEGIKHFNNDTFLINELAILSRILYRMKMKFRSSKHFKLLEKLRHSLDTYYGTKFCWHLRNLLDTTPCRYLSVTYLPSRNMLLFILVRLQGMAKLMERAYDMCIIIAFELNKRLYIGHFWKLFLILFALISRIAILIKCNTKFLCDLYSKLLHHSNKLEPVGDGWLPKDYKLPSDLRLWLGVQWVYEEDFVDLTYEPTSNEVTNLLNLVDEDEDDVLFCNEYILLDDEDKNIISDFNKLSPIKETLSQNRMRGFSINEDDIGEDIGGAIEIINDLAEAEDKAESDDGVLSAVEEDDEDVGEEIINDNSQTNMSICDSANKEGVEMVREERTIETIESAKKRKFEVGLRPSSVKKKRSTQNLESDQSVICLDDTQMKKTEILQTHTLAPLKKNKKKLKRNLEKDKLKKVKENSEGVGGKLQNSERTAELASNSIICLDDSYLKKGSDPSVKKKGKKKRISLLKRQEKQMIGTSISQDANESILILDDGVQIHSTPFKKEIKKTDTSKKLMTKNKRKIEDKDDSLVILHDEVQNEAASARRPDTTQSFLSLEVSSNYTHQSSGKKRKKGAHKSPVNKNLLNVVDNKPGCSRDSEVSMLDYSRLIDTKENVSNNHNFLSLKEWKVLSAAANTSTQKSPKKKRRRLRNKLTSSLVRPPTVKEVSHSATPVNRKRGGRYWQGDVNPNSKLLNSSKKLSKTAKKGKKKRRNRQKKKV